MNKLLTCLVALLVSQAVHSQKDYFVYLQSEEGQPFFVRMNEQTYSSSSSGYLILSQMRDSSYTFRVGWPGKPGEQPLFTLKVGAKDRGLLLKHFAGEGWGLFDLQTLTVLRAEKVAEEPKPIPVSNEKVSSFTDVLARAANDPSLRERKPVPATIPKETPKKQVADSSLAITKPAEKIIAEPEKRPLPAMADTGYTSETVVIARDTMVVDRKTAGEIAASAKDTLVVEKVAVTIRKEEPEPPGPVRLDTVLKAPAADISVAERKEVVEQQAAVVSSTPLVPSQVTRRSESSTSEGFGLVYTDQYADGRIDTVRILIPNPRNLLRTDDRPGDKRFLEDISSQGGDSVKAQKTNTSTCTVTASENDFLQLRKRMAAQKADDAMIAEARKAFKQKCYTVKHIRNLGVLFLNDAARFQFYEAAYPRVADPAIFESLGAELKNEYYNRRFQTLLGGH